MAEKLTKGDIQRLIDVVVEQATEAAMYGSGFDDLDAAVYCYLRGCGAHDLADHMLERNAVIDDPAGRTALQEQNNGG